MGFLGMPDHHADYYEIDDERDDPPAETEVNTPLSEKIGCVLLSVAFVGLVIGLLIYLHNY